MIADAVWNGVLLREVGMALAGFVFGASIVASIRYFNLVRSTEDPALKGRYNLVVWMIATLGVFALFQGITRALLISDGTPIDYRDWTTVALQVNSLALLGTMIHREGKHK